MPMRKPVHTRMQYLEEEAGPNGVNAFERQVALADRILLNKSDLVGTGDVDELEARLRYKWEKGGAWTPGLSLRINAYVQGDQRPR